MRLCATALVAVSLFAESHAHASPMYVYRGGGCDGVKAMPAWEAFISKNQPATIKADGAVDFVPYNSWTSFDGSSGWSMGCWRKAGYKLALSVPLTVSKTTLAQVAAGAEDAHFIKLGQNLATNGFNTPTTFIRLAWEFNGGWYPFKAYGNKAAFLAAWQRVVPLIRAGAPNVQIVWNIAEFPQQTPDPSAYYPGDAFVDVVATDVYNNSWAMGVISAPNVAAEPKMWNNVYGSRWGIKQVIAFAAAHRKPYAFPEWATGTRPDGHGGGDDATFIQNMAPLVAGAAMSGYWDYPAGDYQGKIDSINTHLKPPVDLINARAAFLRAFYPAPR